MYSSTDISSVTGSSWILALLMYVDATRLNGTSRHATDRRPPPMSMPMWLWFTGSKSSYAESNSTARPDSPPKPSWLPPVPIAGAETREKVNPWEVS